MAVPRLRVPPSSHDGIRQAVGSEEVELYHRTYTTLLRSSGETRLRILEPSHAAMRSSLHAHAAGPEPDLGAFLYALHRLPHGVWRTAVVVMGQDKRDFVRGGLGDIERWTAV